MKNIAIYMRTSKDTEEGTFSLPVQEKKCMSYIEDLVANGIITDYEDINQARAFTKFYTDKNLSGADSERPSMKQLMREVSLGNIGTVVVYMIDRLSRDTLRALSDILLMRDKGVNLYASNHRGKNLVSVENAPLLVQLLIEAGSERTNKMKKTLEGKIEAINSGLGLPTGTPYGFERTLRPNSSRKYFSIVEPDMEIVRFIFAEYLRGQTPKEIADFINNTVEYRKNTPFRVLGHQVTVYKKVNERWIRENILSNPVYAGYNYRRDDENKRVSNEYIEMAFREVETIIDFDTFLEVQKKLGIKERTVTNSNTYLFRKLLTCGNCGSELITKKDRHNVYICKSKRKKAENCSSTQWKSKDIDNFIFDRLTYRLENILTQSDTSPLVLTNRIKMRSSDMNVEEISKSNLRAYMKKEEMGRLIRESYENGEMKLRDYKVLMRKYSEELYKARKEQVALLSSKKHLPEHPLYLSSKRGMLSTLKTYRKEFEEYIVNRDSNASEDLRRFCSDLFKILAHEIRVKNEVSDKGKNQLKIEVDFYDNFRLKTGTKISV